ncbi:WASH complex subunit 3 isoform X1 [Schistocerca piceifrons]|uniref:WASH complex subunit 3 isoform X1 n=1 Tax=Schistocerca piceifrons TaxID=274613 RepID=UPI001F5F569D|nr:WASH complex subunit 3 isoform X1 [Schistocerca piceifrons]
MDVDGLPIIGPGVDYTQPSQQLASSNLKLGEWKIELVTPIHQKRMYAFINHFITNTVSFLNKFSQSCELRLEKFDSRLQKLEASLCILETKLNSIAGLDEVPVTVSSSADKPEELQPPVTTETTTVQPDPQPQIDPTLSKFVRMIQVGVPVQAVRMKMQAEGMDPSVLDNYGALSKVQVREEIESDTDSSD